MNYLSEKYSLSISENVLEILTKHKQDKMEKLESGGVLLGYVEGQHIHISRASFPNCFDKQQRFSFDRNQAAAQTIIDYELVNSNFKMMYLGEWHTDPEESPKITKQDEMKLMNQIKMSKHIEPFVIIIIQGISETYVGYYERKGLVRMLEKSGKGTQE